MEKHLQKLIFFLILAAGAAVPCGKVAGKNSLFAQTPSVVRHIRFPLWADLDAYPELEEAARAAKDKDLWEYDFPVKSIRSLAPYLVGGMVYGWEFVYTPSDKARQVEEFLEVREIVDSKNFQGLVTYSSPWLENNRFNCWCEYTRNESQIQYYNLWTSIKNPVISGIGYGDLADGFDGIKNAADDALKNAVRQYFRNLIKNKPKEISGKVLLRNVPTLGIDSGKYKIKLDFFLESSKIVEYKVY